MSEENVFFRRVQEAARTSVYTCSPGDRVVDVAAMMKEKNVSGVVVCADGVPLGMVTDRDLRNKIVANGVDPKEAVAGAVMSSPLISVREDDYLFEAIYAMSRHSIHRVAVLDSGGQLVSVLAETDVLKLQGNTPQQLIRDLEHVTSVDKLKGVNDRTTELVISLMKTGVKTRDLVRLISHINDAIALRAIELLKERFPPLPEPLAFVVLGSEGRMEQTLKTDQDNAIVYGDELTDADRGRVAEFSQALTDTLIAIGVPPCPGGIMVKNAFWRRSLGEWVDAIGSWVATPTPENILNYSMFSDVRTIYGDRELERRLKEQIHRRIRENARFLSHMAKTVLVFPPPLRLFGGFKVEHGGPHRGRLDVKKGGIFSITEGVKVLALESGVLNGGTREKLDALAQKGILSRDELLDLETSYNFLVFIRLRAQVTDLQNGREPSNCVDPGELNYIEKMRLRVGFSVVKSFQNVLRSRYRLNFIAD